MTEPEPSGVSSAAAFAMQNTPGPPVVWFTWGFLRHRQKRESIRYRG
ncbi:hypothetical protein IMZ48_05130 [Candidatus Bathyarchaeota archaeon]|nr:hypothetical protein [Candidatus Bathyarchaeota archaeon]